MVHTCHMGEEEMCVCVHRYLCADAGLPNKSVAMRSRTSRKRKERENQGRNADVASEGGWGCLAGSVGEAQKLVHSPKREANEREEELGWGRNALPKKNDIVVEMGAVSTLMRRSLRYMNGNTCREQGVHVRGYKHCPGVLTCGPKCVGWSQ